MTQLTSLAEPKVTRAVERAVPEHSADATPPSAHMHNAAKLHPKEHGAYAILAIPILSALVVTGPTLTGMCVAIAAFSGFFAHEPLLIVWGHRGRRAQGGTPGAKSRLLVLGTLGIVTGGVAFLSGGESIRWTLLACLALASTSFAVAVTGRHRTLAAQLWGVTGLSLPCVPILVAGGYISEFAATTWAVWLIGFWATTLAVRSVIAAQKRQPRTIHVSILTVLTLLVATSALVTDSWMLISLPMIVFSWYLLIAPPSAKHLRRVGWTLVGGTVLTALLLVGATLSLS